MKLAYFQEKADALIAEANAAGVVLTVEQIPRKPLAMGNYDTVASVREARVLAEPIVREVHTSGWYQHSMCDEQGVPVYFEVTKNREHPFGVQGENFDPSYSVATIPLYK